MNLKLPKLERNSEIEKNNLPFSKEYISHVLTNYLIKGKSEINIDQDYFKNGYNSTGNLASTVLLYYGLISSNNSFDNKGIYTNLSLEKVIYLLNKQEDDGYKRLASGIAKIEVMPNYTEKQLGKILAKLYNNAEDKTKISSLYLFGIKYGNLIEKNNYSHKRIVENANISPSLDTELSKALRISKYVSVNDLPKILDIKEDISNEIEDTELKEINNSNRITGGMSIIYYGAPGCGKSFKVKNKIKDENFEYIRTTFYPDYTNGEFVGQIVPKVDKTGKINYVIQPGYFTEILYNAMINPTKKYCLVIEEINRGNASAIFGDIFQLLDRKDDGSSEFEISNDIINQYFNNNGYKLKEDKITIPSNLWIIATMNTSDQNVYTLDTAFKRRWNLEKISNKFDSDNKYDKKLEIMLIPGSNSVTWKEFIDKINNAIFEKNAYGVNAEDKQIGKYFVGIDDLVNPNDEPDNIDKIKKSFAEKVLMYLWEDVAKLNKEAWFNPKYRTLDELLIGFDKENLSIFNDLFITDGEETDNNE